MADIAFRRLGVEDMQQLYLWLARPHVAKWYAPPPSSFAEMVAKYAARTEEGNVVQSYIASVDGADCGYIQTYPVAAFEDYASAVQCGEGAASVDLFIADSWRLNRGLGTRMVQGFVESIVFGRNGASECVASPAEGNLASIRTFEKAGFTRWKVIHMDGAEPECVMRRLRQAA
ncbi:MAG TPA: GNAT family N-acetyltransferase [Usitatibacter sp.]|nr:GNAT family N-acetyltransferase [Usitatibacter sp.]